MVHIIGCGWKVWVLAKFCFVKGDSGNAVFAVMNVAFSCRVGRTEEDLVVGEFFEEGVEFVEDVASEYGVGLFVEAGGFALELLGEVVVDLCGFRCCFSAGVGVDDQYAASFRQGDLPVPCQEDR